MRLGPPASNDVEQAFSDLKETMKSEFGSTSEFKCAIVVSQRDPDGKEHESTFPLVPVAVVRLCFVLRMPELLISRCFHSVGSHPLQLTSHPELFSHQSGCWGLDSTHKLEANGYQLYTVQYISDNRSGLPLAFFFAPLDHDEYHISAAFRWVENTLLKMGVPWVVNMVMADDDNKGAVCGSRFDIQVSLFLFQ